MKKINTGFFALAIALIAAVGVQAASFSILGGGDLQGQPGTTGTLTIQYDPAPQGNITFADGGIRLAVASSTPGVIKFTGGTVLEAQARWGGSVQVLNVSDHGVGQINAFSVGNPGLSSSAASAFATLNYEFVGGGTTALSLTTQGEDPLFDGILGEDVSDRVSLVGANLTNNLVPEPATLAMLGMGAIGLVLRRRNG